MRKVAEETTVGGEIGPSWKDPSTEPRTGFVPSLSEIPATHVDQFVGPRRNTATIGATVAGMQ